MTATTATTAVKSIGRRMENILPISKSNNTNFVDNNNDDDDGCNWISSNNNNKQQPSPDKTASLDDDCLECSYDDLHEGEDSQPNNNNNSNNNKKTLAHKLLLRGSVRKINMNTTNNDDIIAAAALANADKLAQQQQQQQQLSLPTPSSGSSSKEFGPRFNKILCSNSSSGTMISDLSASLSPTLSSESWIAGLNQQQRQQQQQKMMVMMMQQEEECFGGGGCNLYVHRTRSRSVDDTDTTLTASRCYHREQLHSDRMTTTGGGGGEGILIKAMKSCAVFRDFDAFLGNGGGGFLGNDVGDDDIPPPPPPPHPPRSSNNGGGYQRPAIWGVAPDADDTFDEESYVAGGGGGGGFTHTPFSIAQCNITKDDGELMMKTDEDNDEEEEEYDNVELILDESKMPVSAPPPRKNNRRSKSSPQRGSKKSSMIKKSSNPMRMLLGGRNNNNIIPTNIDSPHPLVTIVQQEDKKNMSVGTTTTTTRDLVVDHIDKSTMAPSPSPTSALEIAAVLQDKKTTINIEESSIQLKETRSRQEGRQRQHSQKKDEEDKNKPRATIASTPPLVSTDSDPTIILHDVATPDRQLRETKTPTTNDEQVLDKLARRSYLPEVCTPPAMQQDLLNKTLEEEFEIDDLVISTTNAGGGAMKDKKTLKSAIMLRSMKKGMNNFKLTAPKTKATTTNTTTASVISDKDIKNARHWNAVYDRSTKKYYYYHKLTREVRWDKPVGFDEANSNNNTTSSIKKRSGLVGIVGKKALGSNKQGDDTGNPHQVKYWRATIDKSTNEVYYYNSKTKEVSWTMPTCLNEKDGKTSHDEKAKEEEEVKLVERSVSTVQMINNIIGKNNVKSAEKKNPLEENNTVSVGTTEGVSNQLIPAPAVEVVANNSNTTDDDVRHWREATDATTGKTYYFHKMTKMVTWVKPSDFKDSHQDGTAAADGPTVDFSAPTKQHTYLADDLSEEAEDDVEKMANVLLPNEQNNESNDVPFGEDEAPFDEQPQKQGSRLKTSSIKQVVTVTPSQFEDDDGEQHDTFDQFSPMPNSGRSNNKSISDQLSRQRTYVSHANSTKSDSTKKVTNTGHIINPSSPGRNDTAAATFDSSSSINSSNIVSEITAIIGSKKMTNNRGGGHKEEENDIPHIPNTSSRVQVAGQTAKTSSKGTSAAAVGGGGSNRKYTSKRAENLGDSSSTDDKDEDDELWSEDDDSVSALSGIGNDSIIFSTNTKKKKTTTMKKRTSGSCKKKTSDQSELPSSSDSFNKWTQEELDLFISKNDWGSVAEYINEIRASKQDVFNRNMSCSSRNKNQSTIREVEDRKNSVISPAEEESIWQSLSSDDEK